MIHVVFALVVIGTIVTTLIQIHYKALVKNTRNLYLIDRYMFIASCSGVASTALSLTIGFMLAKVYL